MGKSVNTKFKILWHFKFQVQPKYYSCVATACFYLSIKFLDEDEVNFIWNPSFQTWNYIYNYVKDFKMYMFKSTFFQNAPSATQLSNLMQHAWKSSDLKRMEMVILQKLDWNLWVETCPSLLKNLCDIIQNFTTSPMLDQLIQKFETCINYSSCAIYSVSYNLYISYL